MYILIVMALIILMVGTFNMWAGEDAVMNIGELLLIIGCSVLVMPAVIILLTVPFNKEW